LNVTAYQINSTLQPPVSYLLYILLHGCSTSTNILIISASTLQHFELAAIVVNGKWDIS